MRILLFALMLALAIAAPASASVKFYDLGTEISVAFPTDGTITLNNPAQGNPPNPGPPNCCNTGGGTMTISEFGGTPVLEEFEVTNVLFLVVGGTTTTGDPGTTVIVDSITGLSIAGGQSGVGDTTSSISWGTLTGYSQTGRLFCDTRLPPFGSGSSCIPFVGFEGTGPPAPLKASAFDTDPWTFDGDGNLVSIGLTCSGGPDLGVSCTTDADCSGTCSYDGVSAPCKCLNTEEIVLLGAPPSVVRTNIAWAGDVVNMVPALPLLGASGLGAALLYLGARALRSKREE